MANSIKAAQLKHREAKLRYDTAITELNRINPGMSAEQVQTLRDEVLDANSAVLRAESELEAAIRREYPDLAEH